ncbi:MAG: PAAR domain-containing protein [Novosphingobium sp.]
MVTGLVPHVGGPILPTCAVTVITCSMAQARVGDMLTCVGPPDTIVKGSASVMVNNMPAARIGDMTAHGGVIVLGAPTVIIGDAGGGGGGGAAPVMTSAGSYLAPAAQAKALINAAKEGLYLSKRCTAASNAAAG